MGDQVRRPQLDHRLGRRDGRSYGRRQPPPMVLQGRPQRHGDRTDGGIFQGAPRQEEGIPVAPQGMAKGGKGHREVDGRVRRQPQERHVRCDGGRGVLPDVGHGLPGRHSQGVRPIRGLGRRTCPGRPAGIPVADRITRHQRAGQQHAGIQRRHQHADRDGRTGRRPRVRR